MSNMGLPSTEKPIGLTCPLEINACGSEIDSEA